MSNPGDFTKHSNVSENPNGSLHFTYSIGGLRRSFDVFPDGRVERDHFVINGERGSAVNRQGPPHPFEPDYRDWFK